MLHYTVNVFYIILILIILPIKLKLTKELII